jgi:hypothetical protein
LDPTAGDILRFRRAVEALCLEIADAGIAIYNTSPICQPMIGVQKATLDEAIQSRPHLELVSDEGIRRLPRAKQTRPSAS